MKSGLVITGTYSGSADTESYDIQTEAFTYHVLREDVEWFRTNRAPLKQ
jgi:hypothetical protein